VSQTTFDKAILERLAILYDDLCKTKKPKIPKFMNRADVLQMFNQPAWPCKREQVSRETVSVLKRENLIPDSVLWKDGKKRSEAELQNDPAVLAVFEERKAKRRKLKAVEKGSSISNKGIDNAPRFTC
jgi:hypothetical protein